jgi:hypothetical protein
VGTSVGGGTFGTSCLQKCYERRYLYSLITIINCWKTVEETKGSNGYPQIEGNKKIATANKLNKM